MEGTRDKHNKKKIIFLRDYWTKSDGIFSKMQIISYSFKLLKHVDWFIILKVIDAESPVIILEDNLYVSLLMIFINQN